MWSKDAFRLCSPNQMGRMKSVLGAACLENGLNYDEMEQN